MCHIYLSSDPIQYEARSRALRIHGVATTIRLENEFWGVLQRIAESEGKTTNQIITELYDEAMTREAEETPRNFASVLRVSCCRYLALHGDPAVVRRAAPPLVRVAASAPLANSLELVRTK
jgi:predicted DNA-binding ribbon-helix-helix protein